MSSFKCSECSKLFNYKRNLVVHLRKIHKQEPCGNRERSFKCDVCEKMFISKKTLQQHCQHFHAAADKNFDPDSRVCQKVSRLLCPADDCREAFRTYTTLRDHLFTEHAVENELQAFEFTSVEDFEKWKDELQQEMNSCYRLDTGKKQLSDGTEKKYFNCYRSFEYKPKGKQIRKLKSTGSTKIGKACPSRIEVSVIGNVTVQVKFWPIHYGHSFDLGHMKLSKEARENIAEKLQAGVSFDDVLDSVRDCNVNNTHNQRLSLLKRKDLHNIVRDFNIDYGTKRHQNDAISVKLWVDEMKTLEDDCPVLYYKGQDEEDDQTYLNNSDFLLIIMTPFQAQRISRFDHSQIVIDGTHGTNAYDTQLYTIITVDESGTACPVAFCLSNRADEYIFSLFFNTIKLNVGTINANIFMSDNDPAFYNAWSSVMGSVEHTLLCTWHVDKNWRKNLSKIHGSQDKKVFVYRTLRSLLQIACLDKFHKALFNIIEQLSADEDTEDFAEYFKTYYSNQPETWASCYRVGLGINTNMYLETFHKTLKNIYLEGRKVKRLDKTIHDLMTFSRDSLFNRAIQVTKNKPNEKVRRIQRSHKSSENITLDVIQNIESDNKNGGWLVQLQSSESCDSTRDDISDIPSTSILIKNTEDLIEQDNFQHQKEPNTSEKIDSKTQHILTISKTVNISPKDFRIINTKLDQIINVLNKCDKIKLETKESVDVEQKVDKKLRFYSTKKVKEKRNKLYKPSIDEANVITQVLDGNIINIHSDFDHNYT